MPDIFLPPGAHSVQCCAKCGAEWPELYAAVACGKCDGLLEIAHAQTEELYSTEDALSDSGVWNFHPLVMPGVAAADIITHPEGNTPLLARRAVQEFAGVRSLLLKHEGHNPTGSFKDRGMTVVITQAKRVGATAVACASTGNTSASLASYAAQAEIPALVFVPRGQIALGKLAQSLGYGAQTLLVDGDFDACLRLARDANRELGVYLVNSLNPWRLEGQKTIVFELLEQLAWSAPDWIALPAGALGNTSAFGKALREVNAMGLIDKVPRILAVQAAGAAPFAKSFEGNFSSRETIIPETVATAIRIGDPASWDRAVRAIRETNGVVTSVTDDEILDAKAEIDGAGVGCEPASAASVAGVKKLRAAGVIKENEQVVAVLTGHMLKDPEILVKYHSSGAARANHPIEIAATLAAVDAAMKSSRTRVRA